VTIQDKETKGYSRPIYALYMHSFEPSDEDRTSDFESDWKNKLQLKLNIESKIVQQKHYC